jgi:hypothetical protein
VIAAKLTVANAVAALMGVNVISALATVWDHVDVWEPFANTLLLVFLAWLARKNSHKIDATHDSVHKTAQTAAHAAEAAAESARVAKAIGSNLRTDLPLKPAEDT